MKTLVIIAHPQLHHGSGVNKRLAEALQDAGHATVHELYSAYPNGVIDVAHEQKLAMKHERIILQFPFWWYSSPPLLKQWLDEVLTFGWAYGPGGDKLHGKELGLAISTGSDKEAYTPEGYNRFTMEELTRPYAATSHLIGMTFLPIFVVHGAMQIEDAQLENAAEKYVKYVSSNAAEAVMN